MNEVAGLAWPLRALLEGGRLVGRHPLGVLLPAGGVLLLHVLAALAARELGGPHGIVATVAAFAGTSALATLASVPLRAAMIGAGATGGGRASFGVDRSLSLLGVELVVAPLVALLVALVLVPTALVAVGLATYGWFATAAVAVAVGAVVAEVVSLFVRAAFAFAPAAAVVDGRSGLRALRESLALAPGQVWGAVFVLFVGDVAVSLGALSCGAGALPGYPLSDLALLSRWCTLRPRGAG